MYVVASTRHRSARPLRTQEAQAALVSTFTTLPISFSVCANRPRMSCSGIIQYMRTVSLSAVRVFSSSSRTIRSLVRDTLGQRRLVCSNCLRGDTVRWRFAPRLMARFGILSPFLASIVEARVNKIKFANPMSLRYRPFQRGCSKVLSASNSLVKC